jgi:predicted transcriptional regulator of viral defense system/very-short-patch-repair endonuclease
MGAQDRKVEQILGRIASKAHGVVTMDELHAAGVSRREVGRRLQSGLLLPVYRGVYRVGHRAPSPEARYAAAVKACDDEAVLSGRAAAWAWGLTRTAPPLPEVNCPTERRVKGVRTRRTRRLDPRERTVWKRIPITTVPRTIVDLPSLLSFDELSRAVHEADVRHGTRPEHIEAVLARYPNAPGAATLRAIASGDSPTILSQLEKHFRAVLVRHALPLPRTNRKEGMHYVDCRWPEQRLTVELDSYRFHRSRRAWEQDRERERAARARGDEFRRLTWRDVVEEPDPTVSDLRALLYADGFSSSLPVVRRP